MMKAENVKVDIDMLPWIRSGCKRLEVEQIQFEHFEVIFEKRSLTESNFGHVLHHIAKKEKEEGVDPALKKLEAPAVVSTQGQHDRKQQKKPQEAHKKEEDLAPSAPKASKSSGKDVILALREVLISDIGARVS